MKWRPKGNSVSSQGSKSLPRNPSDCIILDTWDFDNFIWADKLLAKASRSVKICLSISLFLEVA